MVQALRRILPSLLGRRTSVSLAQRTHISPSVQNRVVPEAHSNFHQSPLSKSISYDRQKHILFARCSPVILGTRLYKSDAEHAYDEDQGHDSKGDSILLELSVDDVHTLVTKLGALMSCIQARHDELIGAQSGGALSKKQRRKLRALLPIMRSRSRLTEVKADLNETHSLMNDSESDDELKQLAQDEYESLQDKIYRQSIHLLERLLDTDISYLANAVADENSDNDGEDDDDNENEDAADYLKSSAVLLEIRAGTGGVEAALFAAELVDMYSNYAKYNNWVVHVVSRSDSDLKGTRETVLRVSSADTTINVLGQLSCEAGVHRVQRVPKTESQGRVHTSTASVAVLPDMSGMDTKIRMDDILKPNELQFDTYRASGAGGQHVNTTDSAVRVTHVPTGMVATCQDERSQHRNRAVALETLGSKLLALKLKHLTDRQVSHRRKQLGAHNIGERSDRIRTYNFQQKRVTDHRINLDEMKLLARVCPSVKEVMTQQKSFGLQMILQGAVYLKRINRLVQHTHTLNKLESLLLLATPPP